MRKGSHHSPQSLAKLRSSLSGVWTPEARAKKAQAMRGNGNASGYHTAEARLKMSASHKGKDNGRLGKKFSFGEAWRRSRKYREAEHILAEVLLAEFPVVVREKWFGKGHKGARVDAYLPPPYHLAFEADGESHRTPTGLVEDFFRDKRLLEEYGLPVVRISYDELAKMVPA